MCERKTITHCITVPQPVISVANRDTYIIQVDREDNDHSSFLKTGCLFIEDPN